MPRTKLARTAAALAACLALAFPTFAAASGDRPHGKLHGQGHAGEGHHSKGHHGKRMRLVGYVLKGSVKSVDTAAGTLVLTVRHSNRHGRVLHNKDITVDVAPDTRVVVEDHNGDGARNLLDVAGGDVAKVHARLPKRLGEIGADFRTLAKRVFAKRPKPAATAPGQG